MQEVKTFQLAWNVQTNQGWVKLNNNIQLKVTSLSELAGWATLLQEKPLFMEPNGWIHTGQEPVGDD